MRLQLKEDPAFFTEWFNIEEMMFKFGLTEKTLLDKEIEGIEQRKTRENEVWYTVTDKEGNILGETGLLRMWPV